MFVYSVNAVSKHTSESIKIGEKKLFIVYVDFADSFGAQYLAKLYLLKAGFEKPEIEESKELHIKWEQASDSDEAVKAAHEHGYFIQMFDA